MQRPEGVNSDDDDYVEIWNLVFMQYDRDAQGKLTPLSKPSIDTGMGMERLTSILQGVKNDYETDLFQPIIQRIMVLTGGTDSHYREYHVAYNAIADHSRAIAFMMADGVQPGNGGRNYVLRRIIRRAAYFGRTLGLEQPFLTAIMPAVIDIMGSWYPELHSKQEDIFSWTIEEEKRFQRTLTSGLRHLEEITDIMLEQGDTLLPGQEAFKLHDTYGFPLDLTQKILVDRGLSVDVQGYEDARHEQQQRSRTSTQLK
jgi:alanyl-tRNA synthetase